jgi:hypothetical protein
MDKRDTMPAFACVPFHNIILQWPVRLKQASARIANVVPGRQNDFAHKVQIGHQIVQENERT